MDFDWKFYILYYDDLKILKTEAQALSHYRSFGKKENRLINKLQTECFGKELEYNIISKGISNLPENTIEININEINFINEININTIYLKDKKYYVN
jgi:hypothetical protein